MICFHDGFELHGEKFPNYGIVRIKPFQGWIYWENTLYIKVYKEQNGYICYMCIFGYKLDWTSQKTNLRQLYACMLFLLDSTVQNGRSEKNR